MENKTFYMVYLEEGRTPTHKHSDYTSAFNEAQRLARIYRTKAYVLVTMTSVELSRFTIEDLRPEYPLPF